MLIWFVQRTISLGSIMLSPSWNNLTILETELRYNIHCILTGKTYGRSTKLRLIFFTGIQCNSGDKNRSQLRTYDRYQETPRRNRRWQWIWRMTTKKKGRRTASSGRRDD